MRTTAALTGREAAAAAWPLGVKAIDLWELWLFAETEASLMLHAWQMAPFAEKASAHAGYRAALEREEQAARVLAARVAHG
jgi:PHP family Zn ribbon phosphoesterase